MRKQLNQLIKKTISIAVVCSMFVGMTPSTIYGAEKDAIEIEVDGSASDAINLADGENYTTAITTSDEPVWFKISPGENTYSYFIFEPAKQDSDGWKLTVYDMNMVEIKSWIAGDVFSSPRFMFGDNQPYYLKVVNKYPDDRGVIGVNFTITAKKEIKSDWEHEPNDSKTKAETLKAGLIKYGTCWKYSDVDYYKYTATMNGKIKVSFANEGKTVTDGWDVQVMDSDMNVLNDTTMFGLGGITSNYTSSDISVEKGKNYYVMVKSKFAEAAAWCPLDVEYSVNIDFEESSVTDDATGFDYINDTWKFENLNNWTDVRFFNKFFDYASAVMLHNSQDKDNSGWLDTYEKHGHCYGMALTAASAYGGYPKATTFNNCKVLNDANINTFSNQVNCSAEDLVSYGYVYQYTEASQKERDLTQFDYNGLVNAINENAEPVEICIFGKEGGHALLGIKLEKDDDAQSSILVYDCNYPNQKRYLTLSKASDGSYNGWSYQVGSNMNWGSPYTICYNQMASEFQADFIGAKNVGTLMQYDTTSNATLKYGSDVDTKLSDLSQVNSKQVLPIDTIDITTTSKGLCWLEEASNKVEVLGLSNGESIKLSKGATSISVLCKNESDVAIDLANKKASVTADNANFNVVYDTYGTTNSYFETSITGNTTKYADVNQTNDGALIVSGVNSLDVVCVNKTIDNATNNINSTNKVTTAVKVADKEAAYKIVESKVSGKANLTVSEDKDGDGVFEKVVASSQVATVTPKPTTPSKPVVNNTPKSTSLSKLSAKGKTVKVTWKKQTSNVAGYQIQYATNMKFTKAKTKTVSKNKTTSLTVKKLKANKKYYVRVRTYNKVNGKKIYSAWSKAKTVKTKK